MSDIVIISGSPSETSRSEKVLTFLGGLLEKKYFSITHVSVRDIPHADLFNGNYNSPAIKATANLIKEAKGVIVGSPVYKASYAGVLKAFIDLLPQDVLEATPVLPVMTGGSPSHLLALEYALKPLLAILKGQNLKGVYLVDSEIDKEKDIPVLNEDALQRIHKQVDYFAEVIRKQSSLITV